MTEHFGATSAEWTHFSLMLGLTRDLLPCVSNPHLTISPGSSLKSIGKTPSKLNAAGQVVGIAHWTAIHATDAQIDLWSKHHDYGICLQTRDVRAIDIDVDDLGAAAKIRARIAALLGVRLPARTRPGTGRVVLGCRVAGPQNKRVVGLAGGGAVEYLADGQQFIVAGTHPSGARYFWEGGLPGEFPLLDADALQRVLDEVEREFGGRVGAGDGARDWERGISAGDRQQARRSGGSGVGVHHGDPGAADPVVGWLRSRGWARPAEGRRGGDQGRAGELYLHCPWVDQHTGDSGETETVYWPAGTGGYEQGHFKCLHAHCAHRTDAEFLAAVGWQHHVEPELQVVEDAGWATDGRTGVARPRVSSGEVVRLERGTAAGGLAGDVMDEAALPEDPKALWSQGVPGQTLARSKKGFIATVRNVVKALATPGYWRRLGYDEFRDEIMWCAWRGPAAGQWLPWTDEDFTRTRIEMEADGFEPVGRELVRDAVWLVASEHRFDSAKLWLDRLPWDGVERVETFFSRLCGAEDSGYMRATARYMWTAMAGRALSPGVQADMVPVLVGAGGARKSTLVLSLVPDPEFACRVDLRKDDVDNVRKMRGCLVAEVAELRGLHGRDSEEIKDFIAARYDKWTPKYKELATKLPRRCVFIGTTDREEFLADAANNLRRWLPVTVGKIDIDAVVAEREQLWAEAAERFMQHGVEWADAERLAPLVHSEHRLDDDWSGDVARWLASPAAVGEDLADGNGKSSTPALTWGEEGFTSRDVLVHAIGLPVAAITRAHQNRIAEVLRVLGCVRRRGTRTGGNKDARVWVLVSPT